MGALGNAGGIIDIEAKLATIRAPHHPGRRVALTILTGGSSIWPFITPTPLVAERGAAKIDLTTSMP